MTVYISGAISSTVGGDGKEWPMDQKRALFTQAEEYLSKRGVNYTSPLGIRPECDDLCDGKFDNSEPDAVEHSWDCWMRADMIEVLSDPLCKTILLLPGAEYSKGARLERTIFEGLGYSVYEFNNVNNSVKHISGSKSSDLVTDS